MNNATLGHPLFSFVDIIGVERPREAFERKLIGILTVRLKQMKIIWSASAFRGGLNNPEMPRSILKKLETILWLAETLEWHLSKNLIDELDSIIEDIESFNPSFRDRMRRMTKDFHAGRFVTQEQMEKRHRIAR